MVDTKALLEGVDMAALIGGDLGQPVRREGRWLKLISGLVILALGLVMIFKPEWLQLGS